MTAPEDVYVAAATASVRTEGVNDGYIASTVRDKPFRAAVDVAYTATLTAAYWKLRDHAAAYRDTKGFRLARERWEGSGRRDDKLFHKLSIHEHYARGVEAAARDIAELLGVPEHEIERPEVEPQ